MFGLGTHEILLILLLCLVVFGAKRLPEIGGGLGRAIRNFKSGVSEPDQIDLSAKDKKIEKGKDEEQA
jgi:sec-independent protein translocase protein TatA